MSTTVFFGGTFNPPHIAHRKILETVCALPYVSKVMVIPTNIPPHKNVDGLLAGNSDRLSMCRLLCYGINKAEVSDIELNRTGKSYSYDTIIELKEKYEDLSMIIGGDMVTTFTKWFRYNDIIKLVNIFAVKRPGIDNKKFDESIDNLCKLGAKITVINSDMPDISSTKIRSIIENNDDLREIVPSNIAKFIKEKGLYK